MKRLLEIFTIILTSLSADSLDTDVNHVIIDHKGNSIIAIIDSIDLDRVYYKIKNDGETSAMDIDKVYFIYNDYDRIYHMTGATMKIFVALRIEPDKSLL